MLVNFKRAFWYILFNDDGLLMKWHMTWGNHSLKHRSKNMNKKWKYYNLKYVLLNVFGNIWGVSKRYCEIADITMKNINSNMIFSYGTTWIELAQIEKTYQPFIRWLFSAALSLATFSKQLSSAAIYGNNKRNEKEENDNRLL